MPTVQQHLEAAAANVCSALYNLECALSHAKARRYHQNWTDAINKALSDTQATHLQIANTADCLAHRADPPA